MTFKALTGICKGGPLDRTMRTHTSARLPAEGGFYIFSPAKGATPGEWRWVELKGTKE